MQVTPKTFFTDFLLNPLSDQISKTDRAICLIASVILGLLTAGLLHLGMGIYNWSSRQVEDRTFSNDDEGNRVNSVASKAIPHRRSQSADKRDLETIQRERDYTLKTLKEKIDDADLLQDYENVCNDIFDNASQLLAECAEEPELRKFIIESTTNELSSLISIADGIANSVPEAEQSFNQAKWAQGITNLIRQGRSNYVPQMNDQLDALLKEVVNVNTGDGLWLNGTALHHLAKFGSPAQFVEVFASNGIDFDKQDKWENTALLWAVANGNNSMALEILKYKQNLDILGHGNTALHLAIAKGYKERTSDGKPLTVSNFQLMQKMLDNDGADPNVFNSNGYTALHLACVRRDPEMIRELLANGADPLIVTNDGKTCRELLECTFEEANAIIRGVTPPYLLPKGDFDSGYEACLKLISDMP